MLPVPMLLMHLQTSLRLPCIWFLTEVCICIYELYLVIYSIGRRKRFGQIKLSSCCITVSSILFFISVLAREEILSTLYLYSARQIVNDKIANQFGQGTKKIRTAIQRIMSE